MDMILNSKGNLTGCGIHAWHSLVSILFLTGQSNIPVFFFNFALLSRIFVCLFVSLVISSIVYFI